MSEVLNKSNGKPDKMSSIYYILYTGSLCLALEALVYVTTSPSDYVIWVELISLVFVLPA